MTRVLVCGDRRWSDRDVVERELKHHGATEVIHGGAKGADACADYVAHYILNLPVTPFRARWDEYGRSAGPIRNQLMLTEGMPDLVLAFHTNIMESKGTRDMVRRAEKAGVPFYIYEG
jgi:hypothetical protein